jgi:heme-degrading monooxygenase HmoA
MLYNTATLKSGIDFDDVEFALAEMCSLVKETYPDFIAGQVFKFEGFISTEGTVGSDSKDKEHIAIVTYWKSFEAHEESHANEKFKQAFTNLMQYCTDTKELGYKLLWQGEQE